MVRVGSMYVLVSHLREYLVLVMCLCAVSDGALGRYGGPSLHVPADSGVDMTLPQEASLQADLIGQPYMEVSMRAVPVQYFTKKIHEARSYHDVLRIFYGDVLKDEIIDSIITTEPESKMYGPAMGKPRIGGLSDHMSFAQDGPNLEGMITSPVMRDGPLGDNTQDKSEKFSREIFSPRRVSGVSEARFRRKGRKRLSRGNKRSRKGRRKGRRKKYRQELIQATEHVKEMELRTQCRDPVPVVVRIRDISRAANKEYFPSCTIVHQCRSDAGCCNETSQCAPKTNNTISKSFFALEYVLGGDHVLLSKRIVETLEFVNHTECQCKPIQQLPKCLECPHPFNLRRENKTECTCDCFDREHTCIRIKKGRKPLSEDQLQCIKENKCHRPKCQYGWFNEESIKTGYCPRSRHHMEDSPASGQMEPLNKRRSRDRW